MVKKFLNNLFCKQTNQKINSLENKLQNELNAVNEKLNYATFIQDKKWRMLEKTILQGMTPAKGKLRELQLEIYQLLVFLKKVCLQNNLIFWIQGGTLLGAARHQGFVPWDDDIDCGMPRCDLETLKEILKNNDEYEIIDCYNFIPAAPFACRMPKLISKNNSHVFLDIFPYDFVKVDNEENYWNNFKINRDKLTNELAGLNFENPDCPIDDISCLSKVQNIINKYLPEPINREEATHIVWGVENLQSNFCRLYKINEILPNKYLLFEDDVYPVPCEFNSYLKRQYDDIWRVPDNVGELEHFIYSINSREKVNSIKKERVVGYTAGAFDLFHIGHLNLLKKAKENCDYLIVGITTDELIEKTKGKRPFVPLSERIDIVSNCKFVDKVVVQDDLDKFEAWKNYQYNVLFSGDDWKNAPRWIEYEEKLNSVGARIEYFQYTKTTSSSKIQKIIENRSIDEVLE